MSRFSLTLAALLAPAALAVPKVPGYGYGGYSHPSGVPQSGGSLGPIGSSTAPFGFTNATGIAGPTGTGIGTGVSSLPASTVTVIPIPESSPVDTGSGAPTGQPTATGNSPIGGSSGAEECGPATVTVTSANTVTVTVGAGPISSAEESSPISASSVITAPYPIGNGTTAGPTGTGTGVGPSIITSSPSAPLIIDSSPVETPVGPTSVSSELPVPVYTGLPTSTDTLAPIAGASSSVTAHGYHHVSLHQHHSKHSTPVYIPESSTSAAAPVIPVTSTSSPVYVAPTSTSSPVYVAPTPTSSVISTPSSSPSNSGGSVVARGLVYNTAALTSLFEKDTIGWCYNWDSSPDGDIPSGMNFVPMLWSTNQYHLPNWESNVKTAISNGATHILGFNEPDLSAQANMTPEEAAGAWDNMEKFGDSVQVGSPAVCNGGGDTGLNWLSKFMTACSSCKIDFIAIHWYGDANQYGIDDLKQHIKDTQAIANGRPIWLTEFQPSGSVEDQANFMNTMLPYLDDKSNGVERYAYFEVDGILASGNALTELGSKYIS